MEDYIKEKLDSFYDRRRGKLFILLATIAICERCC